MLWNFHYVQVIQHTPCIKTMQANTKNSCHHYQIIVLTECCILQEYLSEQCFSHLMQKLKNFAIMSLSVLDLEVWKFAARNETMTRLFVHLRHHNVEEPSCIAHLGQITINLQRILMQSLFTWILHCHVSDMTNLTWPCKYLPMEPQPPSSLTRLSFHKWTIKT